MNTHDYSTLAKRIEALSVGKRAAEIIPVIKNLAIIGITSQGVFLLAGDDVFFISFGSNRGPLTITLGLVIEEFQELHIGSDVIFQSDELFFPNIKTGILWNANKIWTPPPAATFIAPPEQRRTTLQELAAGVLQNKEGEQGFTPFLGILINGRGAEQLSSELQSIWHHIPVIQKSLAKKDVSEIVSSLLPIMGLGRGLTPSGDDLIAGILLTLNRYPAQVFPDLSRKELNLALIQNARQKTTRLSTNIIEQAATGVADERLLKALDNIMIGSNAIDASIQEICHLGHSSGADTLVGITIALTC